MYYFTADEHYGHANIIKYCSRPFKSAEEMDQVLIVRHNSVVTPKDTTVHIGDFCEPKDRPFAESIIKQLNGQHIFLPGSHDHWLNRGPAKKDLRIEQIIWTHNHKNDGKSHVIVCCHYAMRSWPRSHYNTWQLYGHHHGNVPPYGLQLDVGVDTNNFYPYSLKEIFEIMEPREELFKAAFLVFENNYKDTWDWLTSPAHGLDGAIPNNFIGTPGGFEEVKNLLIQIDEGIFS